MTLFSKENNRIAITRIALFCGLVCTVGWATVTTQSKPESATLVAAAPSNDSGTKGTGSAGKSLPFHLA